jgi:hypothetical protein
MTSWSVVDATVSKEAMVLIKRNNRWDGKRSSNVYARQISLSVMALSSRTPETIATQISQISGKVAIEPDIEMNGEDNDGIEMDENDDENEDGDYRGTQQKEMRNEDINMHGQDDDHDDEEEVLTQLNFHSQSEGNRIGLTIKGIELNYPYTVAYRRGRKDVRGHAIGRLCRNRRVR